MIKEFAVFAFPNAMKQYYPSCECFLLHLLLWFHALWMINSLAKYDELALLDFKNQISDDPLNIMSSWNSSIHFCNWTGVTCSQTDGRVTNLNLESLKLAGTIPPSIGNLSSLASISLRNNSFHGEVPPEIGRLRHLQAINLSYNHFSGSIPENLSRCTELTAFHASYNEFIGEIPDQLSSLLKLEHLILGVNNLTGKIPSWIGNFSSLLELSLTQNNFWGSIPEELGLIQGLLFFQLAVNNLSGKIPSSIYNISSIFYFAVSQNQLHGQFPSDLGLTLPNLEVFICNGNYFTGSIPVSLTNASNLQQADFSRNGFTGAIHGNFGSLQGLSRLNFEINRLGNGDGEDLYFLSSLANCTGLTVLGLDGNQFGGKLPNSIGNLSTELQFLAMGSNLLDGDIPVGIGNLVNLKLLALENNYLSGSLPDVIGSLSNLEMLYLNENDFSGLIPLSLGNLTKIFTLVMGGNKFQGSIPPSLGNCQKLQQLDLSSNKLNGTIPKQVISLSSLSISLDLSCNILMGSLPLEVGSLGNLADLDVSKNKLSGEIPSTLQSCTSLIRLSLESNMFQGAIPQSLENLRGLEELDLSNNNFSGQIPVFLSKFSFLQYLNLSYNKLYGQVPEEGIFTNVSAISLVGNGKICGGVPKLLLPRCPGNVSKNHISIKVVIPIIFGAIVATLMLSSFVIYYKTKSSCTSSTESSVKDQLRLSYSDVLKSTNNFSNENLIGVGSFGSVYKGSLFDEGKFVAIKVLKVEQQGALKSFINECNALKSIRHRNILKIVTVCSSIDFEGNDFKCLVFEFMSNGSLDKWLHPTVEDELLGVKLNLMQRLNIAIDIASAFDYLHHHCETPIVHCDLKPSNVLLDEDMTAHVGDFGLATFLFETSDNSSQNQTMSAALRGSIGYIPPEYRDGHVSRLGDIYSYGILLLEIFTGKRPTDDVFRDEINIQKFISMALPNHVMDIVDPTLLFEEEDENGGIEEATIRNFESPTNNKKKVEELLVQVMRIGLMCSTTSPRERMAITNVVNNLKAIRDSFLEP